MPGTPKAAAAAAAASKAAGRQGTVREKGERLVFKGYLQSGLEPVWPVVPPAVAAEIQAKLAELAAAVAVPRRENRKRKGAPGGAEDHAAGGTSAEGASGERATADDEDNSTGGCLRADLAVGVNEVTRGLEAGRLVLIIVARGPTADVLTRHLLTLAHLKGVTVCALSDIASSLARFAGVGRASAVAVKATTPTRPTRSPPVEDLLGYISARAVRTVVPWLPQTAAQARGARNTGYVDTTVRKVGFKSSARKKART